MEVLARKIRAIKGIGEEPPAEEPVEEVAELPVEEEHEADEADEKHRWEELSKTSGSCSRTGPRKLAAG